ncbi:Lipolytic protein [Thauera humireducens]|uniref:alpha/beta hydrolase n=1 Tax=Thauera humireducens TaxID=1134435 RepID=UPI002467A739|nr:alpha/beta hydrolase [Thauera humireducens]CAH1749375.1 Lipolytic protein [Thauera humireducens]
MRLDPQAQAIADQLAQSPRPDFSTLSVADYRAMIAAFPIAPAGDDGLESIDDDTLPGTAGPLPVRIFRPFGAGQLPLTVFFHGGGFVSCSIDTHANICSRLAALSGSIVVSVDYRLGPEHRFPAAVDDAIDAVRKLHARASALGADPTQIAVAGDSAGGTLATVVAHALRDGPIALRHQLLLYPVTDAACNSPSQLESADTPVLNRDMMLWFWRNYLPNEDAARDPRASPLLQTDLARLAPATVITAGADPLRDEGEAYAKALVDAGVCVTQQRWNGQFHGFASMLGTLDAATEALAFSALQLRHAFDN